MTVGPEPQPDPSDEELDAYLADVRAGWDAAERERRRMRPDYSGYFLLAAVLLGADRRRAWQIFAGAEYRAAGGYTVPRVRCGAAVPPDRGVQALDGHEPVPVW